MSNNLISLREETISLITVGAYIRYVSVELLGESASIAVIEMAYSAFSQFLR